MFIHIRAFAVRVLLLLLLLLLCLLWINIHGSRAIYAQYSNHSYELYEQLNNGKRLRPEKIELKKFITPAKPTVYLTFDDGPSMQTPKVLDLLKDEGIKASFFVLGKMAEEHPEFLKRMVKEGHTLGNHTYDHIYKNLYGDIAEFWRQIQKTENILSDICGVTPELVRAPGGTYINFNAFYYYDMDEAGYTVMDWNMDSADSTRAGIPAQEILDHIKSSALKHEVILLLHDGAGHSETVKALPEIIAYFKKQGYVFAPLTNTVKPIQFPLVKSKWKQTYSFDQFVLQEARISEHTAERLKQLATADQKAEQLRLLSLRSNRDLLLSYYNEKRVLKPEEYSFKQEKLMVPLQELTALMKANLVWNEQKHLFTVYCGLRKVEFDINKKTTVSYDPNGIITTYGLQNFIMQEGKLEVTLRSTVEVLGNYIGFYHVADHEREVNIIQGFATQMITNCSGIFSVTRGENALLQA
jgi:peptidoglycan/xylan/chitin deacetylase (PgdA/CDA1 family)